SVVRGQSRSGSNAFRARRPCYCVRFSPDGRHLATTNGGMLGKPWDVAAGPIVHGFKQGVLRAKAYDGSFRSAMAFSPDGRYLATRSWPATLWDLGTGKEAFTFGPESLTLYATVLVAFTPDGRSLVEVKGNGAIRVWDIASQKLAATLA